MLDYLNQTFNSSPIPGDILDISMDQNSMSMVDQSPSGSTVSVKGVVDCSNEDDVILLNPSSTKARVRYLISCFKGNT